MDWTRWDGGKWLGRSIGAKLINQCHVECDNIVRLCAHKNVIRCNCNFPNSGGAHSLHLGKLFSGQRGGSFLHFGYSIINDIVRVGAKANYRHPP